MACATYWDPSFQVKGPRATCAKPSMLPCQGPSARLRHLASGAQIAPDHLAGEALTAELARACMGWGKGPSLVAAAQALTWVRGAPLAGPSPMLFHQELREQAWSGACSTEAVHISFAMCFLCFSLDSLYSPRNSMCCGLGDLTVFAMR
jgi:hypothetical protein